MFVVNRWHFSVEEEKIEIAGHLEVTACKFKISWINGIPLFFGENFYFRYCQMRSPLHSGSCQIAE